MVIPSDFHSDVLKGNLRLGFVHMTAETDVHYGDTNVRGNRYEIQNNFFYFY